MTWRGKRREEGRYWHVFNAFSTETIGFARVITGVHTLIYMRKKEKKKEKRKKTFRLVSIEGNVARERERNKKKKFAKSTLFHLFEIKRGTNYARGGEKGEGISNILETSAHAWTLRVVGRSDGIRWWIGRSLLLPSSIYMQMLLATLLLIEGRKKWPIEKRKERNWSPRNYASYLYEYFSSPVVERWRSFKKRGELWRGEGSRENGRFMHTTIEGSWAVERSTVMTNFFFFYRDFFPFLSIEYVIYIFISTFVWEYDYRIFS